MIAVIFEVLPHEDKAQQYFDMAANLREELLQVDGFISVERFRSLTIEGKYVSLSFWRDAAAVEAWFGNANHRSAQAEGRRNIFQDYRIRVAQVYRDYDMAAGRPEL
jgi:heme-degrading monooxygenase HmoA